MISIPQDKFDEDALERLFGAFTAANKSHWQTPPIAMITKRLLEHGTYAYTAGQPDNWSSKLHFVLDEGKILIDISINPKLPDSMKEYAQNIKEEAMDRMQIVAMQVGRE